MSAPVDITSVQQFNDVLESSSAEGSAIVVDFHAEWCGPCKVIAPRFNKLAEQNPDVHFLRVDVDQQPSISQALNVRAMPTFFAIKDKVVVGMLRGADPQGLAKLVKDHGAKTTPSAQLEQPAQSHL